MTGALLPDGVDTVVMQEQAQVMDDGKVRIAADHRVGENIRQAGEDVKQGDIVIEAGARLSPADLGVLASLGIGQLQVKRKRAPVRSWTCTFAGTITGSRASTTASSPSRRS